MHKMLEVMILQGVDLQAGQAYPSRPSWINYHRLATAQPMSDHMVFLKIDIRVGASTGWRMKLASFAEIGTAATRQGDSLSCQNCLRPIWLLVHKKNSIN